MAYTHPFYTSVNRYGNSILYRGYDDRGERVARKIRFSPTMYIPTQHESGYRTLYGQPVEPVEFDTMRDAKEYIDKYEEVANFDVSGNSHFISQFIYDSFPDTIHFDESKVNTVFFDIECDSPNGFPVPEKAEGQITAISLKSSLDDHFIQWGMKDFDESKSAYKVRYIQCDSEAQLLKNFLDYWDSDRMSPDIISGWNIRLFDIPYLVNRISKVLGEDMMKKLSPWRMVSQKQVRLLKKTVMAYDLTGIQQLDYMDLFKKFAYTYGELDDYKLDTVASVVLGDSKISYEEYLTLGKLYEENYQKFVEYSIKDTDIVSRLEEKLGLITLTMTMAYRGGVNYSDTMGVTRIWDTIIYRELMNQNIVVPNSQPKNRSDFPGGYVKDVKPGMYEWVCSFDLNSLYPSIIVQWNISPETLDLNHSHSELDQYKCLNGDIDISDTHSVAANGVAFTNDFQGVAPQIVSRYYAERRQVKKRMLKNKGILESTTDPNERKRLEIEITRDANTEQSIKILMNSLFGAFGNNFFRYFSLPMAEAITTTGQLTIQWAEKAVNQFMNNILGTNDKDYVIAIDTDSLIVNMGDLVNKFNPKNPVEFLNTVCQEKMESVLSDAYQNLYNKLNCYTPRMEMSREVIADRGIWTAKKRYILNVHDNEGVRYTEPKLKIMGIEAIKSSTPAEARVALKEMFKTIIGGSEEESQKAIQKYRDHFHSLEPEQVAAPSGISDLDKWKASGDAIYKKGTPIHVRGALVYNHALRSKGLDKTYREVKAGDKVKFSYLQMPNPLHENVVAFPDYLPRELQLHRYVDHETQFEKTFLGPIERIFDAIGWSIEDSQSLEDFMG